MKKKLIRCYKANVATNSGRQEIYYSLPDFYTRFLYSCLHCGAIFTVEDEDEKTYEISLADLIKKENCPECQVPLAKTLKPYPQSFLGNDGEVRHFEPEKTYPSDSESLVKEVWHLYSNMRDQAQADS